jgi:hypothetical protein
MGERLMASKIGPDELADTDSQPGILREEAFAKPGLWAGIQSGRRSGFARA